MSENLSTPVAIFWEEELTSLKEKVISMFVTGFLVKIRDVINANDANVVVTTKLALIDSSKWYALIMRGKNKEETKILPANVMVYFFEEVIAEGCNYIEIFLMGVSEQLKIREAYFK